MKGRKAAKFGLATGITAAYGLAVLHAKQHPLKAAKKVDVVRLGIVAAGLSAVTWVIAAI